MLEGGWRGVLATASIIAIFASLLFSLSLMWGQEDLSFGGLSDAATFGTITACIFVGGPSVIGILCIQAPAAAWARLHAWPGWAVVLVTVGANSLFTLSVFSFLTGPRILAQVEAVAALSALAAGAALVWLFFDRRFARSALDA